MLPSAFGMSTSVFPTRVQRLPERRILAITWEDGQVCEYPYDYLRGYCPCADCQGHFSRGLEFQAPPQPVTPLSIRQVGNYAIAITWSDGHDTGIYRFELLRRLCPEEEQPVDVASEEPI